MRVLSILRLKPDAGIGLKGMCFEELEMRGLVPHILNYDVLSTKLLSDTEIGDIMSGRHEWVTSGFIQVSDIVRIDAGSDTRFYYCDTNGFQQLFFDFEVLQINLNAGDLLILVVPPECKPHPHGMKGSMEAMREIVGGQVDIDRFTEQIIIVMNMDAQSSDAPMNRMINGKPVIGTFFFCGLNEENAPCSLTEAQLGDLYVHFKFI